MIMNIFSYAFELWEFSVNFLFISFTIFKIFKFWSIAHVWENAHKISEQLTEQIFVTITQVKKWNIASASETLFWWVHPSHYPSPSPKETPILKSKIIA